MIKNDENIEEKEIILDFDEIELDESNTSQVACINYTEKGEEELNNLLVSEDSDKTKDNVIKEEKDRESRITETANNAAKNISSFFRGLGEVGSIVLKFLPTAGRITLDSGEIMMRTGISLGLKVASWVFLPVTCIVFGMWSYSKIHRDCNKIMGIFDKAFTPLKFETLFAYIQSFLLAIEYLDLRGKKIIRVNDKR